MTKKITMTELKKIIKSVVKEAMEGTEEEVNPMVADHFATLRPVSEKEFNTNPKYSAMRQEDRFGNVTAYEPALIGVGRPPRGVRSWYMDPDHGDEVEVDDPPAVAVQWWSGAVAGYDNTTILVWDPRLNGWYYVEL